VNMETMLSVAIGSLYYCVPSSDDGGGGGGGGGGGNNCRYMQRYSAYTCIIMRRSIAAEDFASTCATT